MNAMDIHQCEIVARPIQLTVCLKIIAPVDEIPRMLGEAYNQLLAYLAKAGELPVNAPFVGYFNQDMQALEWEVGFPVAKRLPGQGQIEPGEIPAGDYAVALHVGPYQKIESAYAALARYIKRHGREPTGIAYEFYLDDPSITPQKMLKTQISFPLKNMDVG